jgi:hypothetical protein
METNMDNGKEPEPESLPQPTYWPAIMAIAVCFGLWGVLTSAWLIVVGLVGMVVAAVGWIGDLRDEPDE